MLRAPPAAQAGAAAAAARRAAQPLRWRLAAPLPAPPRGAAGSGAPRRPPPLGPSAHYRFPHPVEPGTRITGSKSKKVIRLWQAEVALETARSLLRLRSALPHTLTNAAACPPALRSRTACATSCSCCCACTRRG
jgi:hypothetical protein